MHLNGRVIDFGQRRHRKEPESQDARKCDRYGEQRSCYRTLK
jgi:hypothetical protein